MVGFSTVPEIHIPETSRIEYMKKGGKVKAKATANQRTHSANQRTHSAKATAKNTVHVHVTKRMANPRNRSSNAGGNLALERQLGSMFQRLGQMSYHPPMYSSMPPLKAEGAVVLPPEMELPRQQANIINLRDLAEHPTLDQLYRDKFVREEHDRQEIISHASHLPSSIDHGSFSERQLLPFSHMSYGDEASIEKRMVNDLPISDTTSFTSNGKRPLGNMENYLEFNYPAEPALSEPPAFSQLHQPMAPSTGQPIPFAQPNFPPLVRQQQEPGHRFGKFGYGYTKEGISRERLPRETEMSQSSAGGRMYYVRPGQRGNQGGGKK